jgi:prepilin-type N-terminal cleavage/methylation domain-containing protein
MRPRPAVRAFTLIEVMITVVIVGVLAVIAAVGYRAWVRSSHTTEATDILSHIRSAEESFRAENGVYLDISTALDLGYLYPAKTPGAFTTAWGASCGFCSHQWSAINVEVNAPVAFGYAVYAPVDPTTPAPALKLNSGTAVAPITPGAPWYIAEAVADVNGDGIYTRIYAFSSTSTLLIDNEGN